MLFYKIYNRILYYGQNRCIIAIKYNKLSTVKHEKGDIYMPSIKEGIISLIMPSNTNIFSGARTPIATLHF